MQILNREDDQSSCTLMSLTRRRSFLPGINNQHKRVSSKWRGVAIVM